MNARFAPLLLVLPLLAFAEPAPATPIVLKGPHYAVTSWAGPEVGQAVLDLMEALAARYNSLFLYDLSKAPTWNVTIYATKADFDKALLGQVSAPPTDFTYLHYSDPAKSVLAAWVPQDSSIDEVKSLAFQGFFQFLWTFLPQPPAWIETGLASVFWNSEWDGKTLKASADYPFLETLQKRWKDAAPDVKALLSAPEGTLTAASGLDIEAWALAAFLLDSPDPVYSRLFGSALANLSATATEEANRNAVIQRFQAVKGWDAEASDLQAYWQAKAGFAAQLAQGTALLKDKNYVAAAAAFQAAMKLRPADSAALYYAGLTAYETKDYGVADGYFAKVDGATLPPGLLAYARGLTAFALKQNDAAKTWLTTAKTADEAQFGKLVAPVLDLIK